MQATFVMKKNLCMHEQDRHRGREREREAQRKRYIPIATVTNDNQPSLKVTKSLYIVTILGQLPFMLFTEIAQTWAVQRDSVNTAIIHSYSTLPRNGRIHGLSKKLQVYTRFIGQIGFVRVGKIRRQKTEPVGSEELKPILKEPMSVVRNHPVLCVRL